MNMKLYSDEHENLLSSTLQSWYISPLRLFFKSFLAKDWNLENPSSRSRRRLKLSQQELCYFINLLSRFVLDEEEAADGAREVSVAGVILINSKYHPHSYTVRSSIECSMHVISLETFLTTNRLNIVIRPMNHSFEPLAAETVTSITTRIAEAHKVEYAKDIVKDVRSLKYFQNKS
ncbi:hypothetical protein M9H77_22675 [Catharanthus roseus]|uniref:Uncharacterized protein n=1 Tax=Catharanthus roseus TaxID=4058 RepID=A0ACC0ASC7_CATRO|nr:hypothetical protein M9H77_22675 [Catharanthus roseus]